MMIPCNIIKLLVDRIFFGNDLSYNSFEQKITMKRYVVGKSDMSFSTMLDDEQIFKKKKGRGG